MVLNKVDLTKKLDNQTYEESLEEWQLKLLTLTQRLRTLPLSAVVLYEGWDAAGKGGSIFRITQKLDPRGFQVWPIGPPNVVEKQHGYLWRFWNKLPAHSQLCIFDRSWYGRVLVERVEKLASPGEIKRAYDEINHLEEYLAENGTVLVKYWMHISKEEQLRRFNERAANPFKSWKITEDDWRNREKWDQYLEAAEEMFDKTDTDAAPWHIIPAECKKYARVETVKLLAESLEHAMASAEK